MQILIRSVQVCLHWTELFLSLLWLTLYCTSTPSVVLYPWTVPLQFDDADRPIQQSEYSYSSGVKYNRQGTGPTVYGFSILKCIYTQSAVLYSWTVTALCLLYLTPELYLYSVCCSLLLNWTCIISYLFGSIVVNLSCKNSHYYTVQGNNF